MKKLIFRKFYLDVTLFFIVSTFTLGLIVWTIQAVNYFDFVTEDGHGIKVYFFYTILNFPKIVHRIFPFIVFVSFFYIILKYNKNNELDIYWLNGISKKEFVHKMLMFSLILLLTPFFLGSYISPSSQFKARSYLKSSNVSFFTSLIKERKFIDTIKNFTLFIEKSDKDNIYYNIFLEDARNENEKIIFAQKGFISDDKFKKKFYLYDGKIIDSKNSKINIFEFDQIVLNLSDLEAKTITAAKIQEINTKTLFQCFMKNEVKMIKIFTCNKEIHDEVTQELIKRIIKPFYIPILVLMNCFLVIKSKFKIVYNNYRNLVFF